MWLLESPFPTTGHTNASGLAVAALSLSSSLFLSRTYACSYHKKKLVCVQCICCMVIVVSVQ